MKTKVFSILALLCLAVGGAWAVNAISLNFDGDDATGVKEVSEVKEDSDNSWYTLDGRKLQDQPTKKGVYINNGRKLVIK